MSTRKPAGLLLQFFLLTAVLAASAQAAPRYEFQRFLEDWSTLDAPPHKFIRLGDNSSLTLGGHLRLRSENHGNFRGTTADDTYTLALATLHADYRSERFRVFAELKSSDVFGDASVLPRSATVDELDIEHLFLDWKVTPAHTLRLGRQTLLFPKPFLHTAKWRNTLRRWDGASWLFDGTQWSGRAFWLHEALTRPDERNRSTSDRRFAGLFTQRQFDDSRLEIYYTDFERALPSSPSGSRADERRQTLGARYLRGLGSGRLAVESNLQAGRRGDRDVSARLHSASFRQPLASGMQATLRVDVASGNDGPGGALEGFTPIYDQVHAVAGRMDALWRSNLIDVSVAVSRRVGPLLLAGEVHSFHRESTDDAVYAPGGKVIAAADGGARRIGEELDLRANWKVSAQMQLEAGFSVMGFSSDIGTTEKTSTYTYLSLEHRF